MACIAMLIGGANALTSLEVLACFRDYPRIALTPRERDTTQP